MDSMVPSAFDILGQHIQIWTNVPALNTTIESLFRSFVDLKPSPEPHLRLAVQFNPQSTGELWQYTVYRDDQVVGQAVDWAHCFRLIEWQIDIFLAEAVQHVYLLHAGAVAHQGCGLIFPGASGQGKSSLTTALILEGFTYLSDELAVIDPTTRQVSAFPKPVSIKNPSLFTERIPTGWFGPEATLVTTASEQLPTYQPVWYAHPADFQVPVSEIPVPVTFIIFPYYDPDCAPKLDPLSKADALHILLENAVNSPHFPGKGLRLLAQLAENARCYALQFNHLETSVALITALVETAGCASGSTQAE
jgi:HprK-related kinase A